MKNKKPHLFSSYCQNPQLKFANQGEKESVLLFLRKHWATNIPWVFTSFVALVFPLLIQLFLQKLNYQISFPISFQIFGGLFYYLVLATYIFVQFITWFYTITLITDERLINIEYSDVVYRHVAATKLDLVQDVSYLQVGAIRSFFDYGTLKIQTASNIENFVSENIPHPEEVIRIIEPLIGDKDGL